MKTQKAIVTIAIGEKYVGNWKKYCQTNWQAYADKYGYDLICLEQPLVYRHGLNYVRQLGRSV